ncbi:hypothetical protein BDV98DRAFT_536232, partial [Pterulicium gracile]
MSSAASEAKKKHVVVIGAGVIGLTTAIALQRHAQPTSSLVSITILAKHFPADPRSIGYTSNWAGAHHVSHAEGEEEQTRIDEETFHELWRLSEPGSGAEDCFLRIPQTEYYTEVQPEPHPLGWMPDFQHVPSESLIPGSTNAASFTTLTIDTPRYLAYLVSLFLSLGGKIVKADIQHIDEVLEGGENAYTSNPSNQSALPLSPRLEEGIAKLNLGGSGPGVGGQPDALIVCPGLGARTLGGVEDKDVYPVRGQTVVLKAPWVKFGRTFRNGEGDGGRGEWTYVIPRRCGDVVIGGTRDANDYYSCPRAHITADIIRRAVSLAPELAPPGIAASLTPEPENAHLVEAVKALTIYEGCGLRPARTGGARIELKWVDRPGLAKVQGEEEKVPVVYHYGHKGSGFQSSWGSATRAVGLLVEAL